MPLREQAAPLYAPRSSSIPGSVTDDVGHSPPGPHCFKAENVTVIAEQGFISSLFDFLVQGLFTWEN